MDFTCLRLVPLIEEPHLSDSCIELLNEEWPRSTALRQKSMQKAMNSMPPLALVLLDESGALLGHARLCPLPLENRACWVESVVVWRRLRGQGLGRVLMEKVEGWAREQQFTKVFLSTTDKMDFYKKCCYSQCQPVLNFGQNSRLFEGKALNGLLNGLAHGSEAQADKSKQTNGNEARPIFVNNQIPIPPPPPPLSPQNSSFQNLGKVYMVKRVKD